MKGRYLRTKVSTLRFAIAPCATQSFGLFGAKYLQPLNFDQYNKEVERLDKINYIEILETIEAKFRTGSGVTVAEEKAKILQILKFFNGVPIALANYYDTEGKFLADWLRKNCLLA